jgi:hypothetical protein
MQFSFHIVTHLPRGLLFMSGCDIRKWQSSGPISVFCLLCKQTYHYQLSYHSVDKILFFFSAGAKINFEKIIKINLKNPSGCDIPQSWKTISWVNINSGRLPHIFFGNGVILKGDNTFFCKVKQGKRYFFKCHTLTHSTDLRSYARILCLFSQKLI